MHSAGIVEAQLGRADLQKQRRQGAQINKMRAKPAGPTAAAG